MNIVDYKGSHGQKILANKMNKGAPEKITKFIDFADSLVVPGLSFTAIHQDKVIASAGFKPLWDGVAEVWFLASKDFHNHKLQIIKITKTKLKQIVEDNNLIRLQTAVRVDWPEAQRFASFMGLEKEGLMRKYGPDGTDYYGYSRVY